MLTFKFKKSIVAQCFNLVVSGNAETTVLKIKQILKVKQQKN